MTEKEYLKRGYEMEVKIKANLEYLSSLRTMATRTNSMLSGMPGANGVNKSRQEDIVIKITMMEEEINKDLEQLKLLKDEIKETIDSIEKPKERLVLSLRYVFMLTWEEIATAMMCSLRYVYILHKRALANVKIPGDSF